MSDRASAARRRHNGGSASPPPPVATSTGSGSTAVGAGGRSASPIPPVNAPRSPLPIIGKLKSMDRGRDSTTAGVTSATSDSESNWVQSDTGDVRSGGEDADGEADAKPVQLLASAPPAAKWRNWWIRTVWTLIMVAAFIVILLAGHAWVVLLVVLLQLGVFREVIAIAHVPSKEKRLPWFRLINWYFLASTNYFLYGESLLQHFAHVIPPFLLPLATHHRFISFLMYCVGLVFFVLNLKRGFYKFQFSQFAWTHMALLLVVVQSHAIINNIYEGLIWFFLPSSLVIVNDVFAYICGFFFGRTPLIKLSPKKTWEGFVGGALCTLVFGFLVSALLIQVPYFICPVTDLSVSYWSNATCAPNPVFLPKTYVLPASLPAPLAGLALRIAPLQLHTLVFSLFASSIAPFGGFFASGVKRAFKIKDFGDTIPGHGGITDRFDCQFIMGTFSFIYVTTFIGRLGAADVLQRVLVLSTDEQLAVLRQLTEILREAGAVGGDAAEACLAAITT
ncbi:phosphatidate cytidylyltransferase [Blastocladiella emersonii ATCC 22665]|nr:phosphatidate cytidylyltransferase [Blastocladiella emersonii ATCC 22665]